MSSRDAALAEILSRWTLPMGLLGQIADWLAEDNERFDRERFNREVLVPMNEQENEQERTFRAALHLARQLAINGGHFEGIEPSGNVPDGWIFNFEYEGQIYNVEICPEASSLS